MARSRPLRLATLLNPEACDTSPAPALELAAIEKGAGQVESGEVLSRGEDEAQDSARANRIAGKV
jgi:hypothetical protein